MIEGKSDLATFLSNVTGFPVVAQDIDFGARLMRFHASGAPALREPTFGIRRLDISMSVPISRAASLSGPNLGRPADTTPQFTEWAHKKPG